MHLKLKKCLILMMMGIPKKERYTIFSFPVAPLTPSKGKAEGVDKAKSKHV
jgi:hypothetical protein